MAAELILHIGGFKTGSTSIQAALAKCNYTVPGKTILYPGVAEREGLAKSRGQHDRLARTLFPNQPVARHREARFAAVARRLRKSDADTDYAVLSAEMFEYVNPQLLAAEIDRHFPEYRDRLRIIGYVRPHAERLVSGYAERVKHGFFLGSLEEFHQASSVKDKPHHWGFFYAQRFARWRACFGDAFQIRPMIRDRLFQQDVVADFFRIMLRSETFRLSGVAVRNTTPSLEDLMTVRLYHEACGHQGSPSKAQEVTGVSLIRELNERTAGHATKLVPSKVLAADIAEVYRADADALDRDFFEGTPMADALAAAVARANGDPLQTEDPRRCLAAGEIRLAEAWASVAAAARTPPGKKQSGQAAT